MNLNIGYKEKEELIRLEYEAKYCIQIISYFLDYFFNQCNLKNFNVHFGERINTGKSYQKIGELFNGSKIVVSGKEYSIIDFIKEISKENSEINIESLFKLILDEEISNGIDQELFLNILIYELSERYLDEPNNNGPGNITYNYDIELINYNSVKKILLEINRPKESSNNFKCEKKHLEEYYIKMKIKKAKNKKLKNFIDKILETITLIYGNR